MTTPISCRRSAWLLLAIVLAPACLGGQTGEPSSGIVGECRPASISPERQLRVWTEALNGLQLRPTAWAHPEDLPLQFTASVNEEAPACRTSGTRTDWWINLTLASQRGTVFSQSTQVLGENVECAGCFRLHLTAIADVENAELLLDAEEAATASQPRAELNATVVGNSNATPTISGNLTVHYRLATAPNAEQTRRFDF